MINGNWSDIVGLRHLQYTKEEAELAVEQLKIQAEYFGTPYTDYRYVPVIEKPLTDREFKVQKFDVGVTKIDESKLSEEDKSQLAELKKSGRL